MEPKGCGDWICGFLPPAEQHPADTAQVGNGLFHSQTRILLCTGVEQFLNAPLEGMGCWSLRALNLAVRLSWKIPQGTFSLDLVGQSYREWGETWL